MELKGKTALVTGAGSEGGLGHRIAEALAREGARIVISGRREAEGRALAAALGDGARFLAADLRDVDQVASLAVAAGEVDVLVNDAAFMVGGDTLGLDPAGFDEMYAVNVRAPYYLAAALIPGMIRRGGGSIVNVSSMGASIGTPGRGAYVATKAALESLTRSLAVEYAASGIQVNAVAPGPMGSPRFLAAVGDAVGRVGETTPIRRIVTPEEVAEAVAFLAGPRAAYAAGSVLAFDGGRTVN